MENNQQRLASKDLRKRQRTAKICENLPYSGREAFKRLRTNVMIALGENENQKCRVIGVTSAQPNEGKSSVTVNLAYSLAELGKKVAVVDGDLRRPAIHEIVGCALTPGVSEILAGSVNLSDALVRYRSTADDTRFDLIPSGEIPDNPAELLNSGRFKKLLEVVSSAFDYIILDLPPVNAVVDAVNVSKNVDGMIVVVRENHCPRYVLSECMEQLKFAKANVLGFVLNGCVEGAGKHHQYKNQYYYKTEK